jgi:sigma-E factor negative regulatory protein RseA
MSNQHNGQKDDQIVYLELYSLERLSANVDAEDLEFFDQERIDLLLSQKQNWEIYHLIGDVMRNPDLALNLSSNLAHQIALRVDQEPALVMPSPQKLNLNPAASRWQRFWPTLAMAAAVASVVWVARPVIEQMQGTQTAPQFARANNFSLAASARLNTYVRAHRDLSGPAVVQARPSIDEVVK